MAFCKYCGKELVNGVCDCPEAVAAAAAAQADQAQQQFNQQTAQAGAAFDQAQQTFHQQTAQAGAAFDQAGQQFGQQQQFQQQQFQQQQYQQGQQFQQGQQPGFNAQFAQQAAPAGQAGALFGSMWQQALKALKKPVTAIDEALNGQKKSEGLLLGAAHLLILFLTTLIHLPLGDLSRMVDTGTRAKVGFFLLLLTAIIMLVKTVIVLIYQKTGKAGANHPFANLLAALCTVTVPGTAVIVLAFLFGLFSPTISIVLYLICVFSWILYGILVIQQATYKDADGKGLAAVIVAMIAVVIGLLLLSLITRAAAESAANNIMNSLMRGFF